MASLLTRAALAVVVGAVVYSVFSDLGKSVGDAWSHVAVAVSAANGQR